MVRAPELSGGRGARHAATALDVLAAARHHGAPQQALTPHPPGRSTDEHGLTGDGQGWVGQRLDPDVRGNVDGGQAVGCSWHHSCVETHETARRERYSLNLQLTSEPDDDADVPPQTVHEMRTPAAREVADLLAMQLDLTFVCEACDLLLNLPTNDPALEPLLTRALWSSALIAYARCFATGKRLGWTRTTCGACQEGTRQSSSTARC